MSFLSASKEKKSVQTWSPKCFLQAFCFSYRQKYSSGPLAFSHLNSFWIFRALHLSTFNLDPKRWMLKCGSTHQPSLRGGEAALLGVFDP